MPKIIGQLHSFRRIPKCAFSMKPWFPSREIVSRSSKIIRVLSLDDVSGIIGGTGSAGAVTLFSPQNPFDTRAERRPSSFDVAHAFTLSAAQDLHFEHLGIQSDRTQLLTKGWELLSISSITSGSPFTVYSGIQQTGAGTIGTDRPDQIRLPDLSSAGSSTRPRDDYFGRGANNVSFFAIPIGIAGGTGPNSGRFGTLGRNTFRGPAFYDFDFALVKTTPIGHRESFGASGSAIPRRVI